MLNRYKWKNYYFKTNRNFNFKGLKELNIILGYKHNMILKELKKIKSIKINYIKMKDYINTGSVYSLYNFKKLWLKKKQKPILMFHTDIIFDPRYLEKYNYQ